MTSVANKWQAIKSVSRIDKPIGTYLLLWPTFWALWIAEEGFPGWHLTIVFAIGVFVMRSAGCIINDIADREIDGHVKRTSERPLASGKLKVNDAMFAFIALLVVALILVSTLSWLTIALSFVALGLAICYPFMKRYTHFPQVVLGAAFGWGMIMAFAEIRQEVPTTAWLLFLANLLWTVAYDTMYAMVDRDDDVKIGVKSTAIIFGKYDKIIILALQVATLFLLFKVGRLQQFNMFYFAGLLIVTGTFIYQQLLIKNRDRDKCFKAFLNNHFGLLMVLMVIVMQYLPLF